MTLKITYIIFTLLMLIILVLLGKTAINKTTIKETKVNKKLLILIGGLLSWQLYIYLITKSGYLLNFDFPPRFAIFLILPLFIFTGVFLYRNRNKSWILAIHPHWLIFYQSFRILVESIFVASVTAGIINKEVTIEGYNYDMIFACTAPIIGFLAFKKTLSKQLLILWNYLGLIVIASIIFLFITSIYAPQLFGSESTLLPLDSVKYPYILVAGFLMPSAVFIHVLSIMQLNKLKGTIN